MLMREDIMGHASHRRRAVFAIAEALQLFRKEGGHDPTRAMK